MSPRKPKSVVLPPRPPHRMSDRFPLQRHRTGDTRRVLFTAFGLGLAAVGCVVFIKHPHWEPFGMAVLGALMIRPDVVTDAIRAWRSSKQDDAGGGE